MLVASTGTVASNYPICSEFSLDGSGCSCVTTCWHIYLPCMSFEARKQLNYEAILALPLILLVDCHNTYFCLPLSLKKEYSNLQLPPALIEWTEVIFSWRHLQAANVLFCLDITTCIYRPKKLIQSDELGYTDIEKHTFQLFSFFTLQSMYIGILILHICSLLSVEPLMIVLISVLHVTCFDYYRCS